MLRRVTVILDQPTRDGDTEIHLLTNVPVEAADATTIAEIYGRRWTIETASQEMEKTLQGEIGRVRIPLHGPGLSAYSIAETRLLILMA
jgi:hypothetical protein